MLHNFDAEFDPQNGREGKLPVTPKEWITNNWNEQVFWESRVGIAKDLDAFRLMEYVYGLMFYQLY